MITPVMFQEFTRRGAIITARRQELAQQSAKLAQNVVEISPTTLEFENRQIADYLELLSANNKAFLFS